jgi:hypothetical protein
MGPEQLVTPFPACTPGQSDAFFQYLNNNDVNESVLSDATRAEIRRRKSDTGSGLGVLLKTDQYALLRNDGTCPPGFLKPPNGMPWDAKDPLRSESLCVKTLPPGDTDPVKILVNDQYPTPQPRTPASPTELPSQRAGRALLEDKFACVCNQSDPGDDLRAMLTQGRLPDKDFAYLDEKLPVKSCHRRTDKGWTQMGKLVRDGMQAVGQKWKMELTPFCTKDQQTNWFHERLNKALGMSESDAHTFIDSFANPAVRNELLAKYKAAQRSGVKFI